MIWNKNKIIFKYQLEEQNQEQELEEQEQKINKLRHKIMRQEQELDILKTKGKKDSPKIEKEKQEHEKIRKSTTNIRTKAHPLLNSSLEFIDCPLQNHQNWQNSHIYFEDSDNLSLLNPEINPSPKKKVKKDWTE